MCKENSVVDAKENEEILVYVKSFDITSAK